MELKEYYILKFSIKINNQQIWLQKSDKNNRVINIVSYKEIFTAERYSFKKYPLKEVFIRQNRKTW